MFDMPLYKEPDFLKETFVKAPNAVLKEVETDGVAPENYHATTIFPEYFKIEGKWLLAEESRMDCVAVYKNGKIEVIEFRNLKKGDLVVVGRTEDASEGIFVHTQGFESDEELREAFSFRQSRSRETAYSKDYDNIYELLEHERENGNIVWVMGPACAFDADSRAAFAALVRNGYVNGL